jgi:tripartite-type tricarboxylate transporter receptor subunit TctC
VTNALNTPVSYDAATAFQPISRVMNSPFFLVVPEKSKLKTVADLIAAGKDRTQVIRYGHPGPGTATHLATELFQSLTGVMPVIHRVAAVQFIQAFFRLILHF